MSGLSTIRSMSYLQKSEFELQPELISNAVFCRFGKTGPKNTLLGFTYSIAPYNLAFTFMHTYGKIQNVVCSGFIDGLHLVSFSVRSGVHKTLNDLGHSTILIKSDVFT